MLLKMKSASARTSRSYGSFAGLDIGTEKVSCAIGNLIYDTLVESGERGSIPRVALVGFAQRASRGISLQGISDLEALESVILDAVYSAEEVAHKNIHDVYVNVPAHLLQTKTVVTEIHLSGQTPIQPFHVRRLFSLSKNISVENDQYVIHIWPLSYQLDSVTNIQDPTGMVGKKLSAVCHIVSTPKAYIQNLSTCIGRCHLDIAGFIADPYAAGLASLVNDEAELGATLIDIGGKSTQIACFLGGKLVWMCSVPLGGTHITSDLARGLSTTLAQAERIKTLYGTLVVENKISAEQVPVTQIGAETGPNVKYVARRDVSYIIKARVDEIFDSILQKLLCIPKEVPPVVYQKVLLSGGSSQFPGMVDFAAEKLRTTVRLAPQTEIEGQDSVLPSLAFPTCAGLLCYALQDYTGRSMANRDKKPLNFWQRLSLWLNEHV